MSNSNSSLAEKIYIGAVVVAMGLLFYANSESIKSPEGAVVELGIGKAFYFPCGIALVLSFFIKSANDSFEKNVNILVAVALMSSLFHPPHGSNYLTWGLTRFVMGLLCFRKLHVVNPAIVIKYFLWASPIIVLPHYVLTNPFGYGAYRYAGFYGDPNFLALGLNFLIAVTYMQVARTESRIEKIIGCISIIAAIPLILVGVSRGGILGLIMIMSVIALNVRKRSKKFFYVLAFATLASSGTMAVRFSDTFAFIEHRFSNESESDQVSTDVRMRGIKGCLTVLSNKPELIPFGIGVGNTMATMAEYRQYGYVHQADLHSTYFSVLYEMGIFGLFFYLTLFWKAYKSLRHKRFYLLLCLLCADMLSLLTLPGASFMPGWILLFFVSNIYLDDVQLTVNSNEDENSNLIHLYR